MNRDEARALMSALLDGELDAAQAEELCRRIEQDAELAREYEQLVSLRRATRSSLDPPAVTEADWDALALRIAARGSEGLGWTLLAPGALALVVGGAATVLLSSEIPLWTRLACGAVFAGLTFLLLSAIADRLRARRVERYDRVNR